MCALLAHALEYGKSVEVGQHHIEDDQMGVEAPDQSQRIGSRMGHLGRHPVQMQRHGDEVGDALLVVHDQDPVLRGRHGTSSPARRPGDD